MSIVSVSNLFSFPNVNYKIGTPVYDSQQSLAKGMTKGGQSLEKDYLKSVRNTSHLPQFFIQCPRGSSIFTNNNHLNFKRLFSSADHITDYAHEKQHYWLVLLSDHQIVSLLLDN